MKNLLAGTADEGQERCEDCGDAGATLCEGCYGLRGERLRVFGAELATLGQGQAERAAQLRAEMRRIGLPEELEAYGV